MTSTPMMPLTQVMRRRPTSTRDRSHPPAPTGRHAARAPRPSAWRSTFPAGALDARRSGRACQRRGGALPRSMRSPVRCAHDEAALHGHMRHSPSSPPCRAAVTPSSGARPPTNHWLAAVALCPVAYAQLYQLGCCLLLLASPRPWGVVGPMRWPMVGLKWGTLPHPLSSLLGGDTFIMHFHTWPTSTKAHRQPCSTLR
jgi:hypothetical protein